MRARLREGFAQFFAKLKDHALEWAVMAVVVTVIPPMLAIEERIIAWLSQFPATWGYRAWLALIVAYSLLWVRWEWHRPRLRFDPESGTYINRKDGFHYCTQCRKEGHQVPLRESKTGWRCFGCTAYYPKPRDSAEA